MWPIATPRRYVSVALLLAAFIPTGAVAQDDAKPESNYVKLLKKAPEARLGSIVAIIGKRGDAADLAFVFARATSPDGFPATVRVKALETLADAAMTRDLRPEGDLSGLGLLIRPGGGGGGVDPASRLAAVRLAGVWKAEGAVDALATIAGARGADGPTRSAALDALAAIGGPPARVAIARLAAAGQAPAVRAPAVAALARVDVDAAADLAAGLVADAAPGSDLAPLVAAFLDRRGGAEKLAAALGRRRPTPDAAKLALRAIYALGRSDELLVGTLSKAAGLDAETRPPTKDEMDRLIAEVAASGDPARGERVFRRADLNCMKCHALAGAAGGVGPELSSLGLSSPVDYVIYSILIPDQSIKEEYQTRVVLTDDGRVLQGIMVEEDDKRLVLRDASAELRTIAAGSIEDTKKGGSLMPKGLANLLTRAEFVDLVRFLADLGKPGGPYALRSVPTIQRWRVLKATPEGLARFVPDPDAFRSQVLEAEPDRWVAAYSLVNGDLPTAALVAATEGKVAYAQGEITVSAPGPIAFRFPASAGLSAWLDDKPLPPGEAPTVEVGEGKHKLTLRVDTAARGEVPVRVEVARPDGSSAAYSVVGGR